MGMQPTTTEVDAYNQAINDQIAGQLGVDSYSPGSFNAMKEVQDRALAGQFNMLDLPGPRSQVRRARWIFLTLKLQTLETKALCPRSSSERSGT
jgi:hypothetical protein